MDGREVTGGAAVRSFKQRCPNPDCRATLSVPENMRGHNVRCAKCGHSFFVSIVLKRTIRYIKPRRKAG